MSRTSPKLASNPEAGRFALFRTRLIFLVLLLVIPAFGLVLYGHLEQRRMEKARVREGAIAVAQLAAANQENFIKNSRQLLATLTDIPFLVLATNQSLCETHFSNLRKLLPDYLNFGLIETNGLVFSSAEPTNPAVNLGDRPYFQRVILTRKFSTGDFQVGRLTGQPALNFAYPVLDERGQLQRVLFASLKLSLLSEAAAKIRLPSGGTVMVIDRNGNVLARHPEPEKWVGKALSAVPAVQRILTQKEGVFEMPGLDGIPRLHAVAAVTDGETPSLFVSVGIPVSVSFAHANETLIRQFSVLGLVAVVVLAAARFFAQRFFLRPVHALVEAAKRLAEGDLSARTGTIQGPAELLQLGHAFDDMAERLQTRRAEVEQAHQQINALNQDLERRVAERTSQLEAANQGLAHERHLLHTLMDNVPVDIYFKDLKSRFLRNNRAHARRFGLDDPAPVVGKTDFDFFSPEHAGQAYEDEQHVIRTGQPFNQEEMETWPDGRVTWAQTIKLPLSDENGRIVGTFGISHDITERKQAEVAIQQLNAQLHQRADQLEAANKELESFSYSVSHDLRAPLRHVQGYVEMLQQAIDGQLSDKARRYLKTITEASLEMGQLIDDLLAFSKMGRSELHETCDSLDGFVRDAIRGLEIGTRGRNIAWKIAPLPRVLGDRAMLKQVLANLLGNAVKYSRHRDPAEIEIGCGGEEDGRQIFFVRDNGAGFDMQYAHKLFGVFQRLHRTDEFEGTGIGLATVRRVIARHGGRTWAEGQVGAGATFYFTLKRAPQVQP